MNADSTTPAASPAPRRPVRRTARRWLLGIGLSLIVLALAGVIVVQRFAGPYLREKLTEVVHNHLRATLRIESIAYHFPFGVTIDGAQLVSDDPNDHNDPNTMLTIRKLELSLAELPIHRGPIIVRSLRISEPVLHIIRRDDRSIVGRNLARNGSEQPPSDRRLKLSDVLQLREVAIQSARIIYEDRARPQAQPIEWRDINTRLGLSRNAQSSLYDFSIDADNASLATLRLRGAIDIDTAELHLRELALAVNVDRDGDSSALPASIQEILRSLGISGRVEINAGGEASLRQPSAGTFAADIKLVGVRAAPRELNGAALDDLHAAIHVERKGDDLNVAVSDFTANAAGARIMSDRLHGALDLDRRRWSIDDFTVMVTPMSTPTSGMAADATRSYFQTGSITIAGGGSGAIELSADPLRQSHLLITLSGVSLQPRGFPLPLRELRGFVRIQNDLLLFQNLSAKYGPDQVSLQQMVVPLSRLDSRIEGHDILASSMFAGGVSANGESQTAYPPMLADVARLIRPAGTFELQGTVALVHQKQKFEPDFALTLVPRHATVTGLARGVTISQLQGEVAITPGLIQTKSLTGNLFGGTLELSGNFTPRSSPRYDLQIAAHDTDLVQLCQAFDLHKEDGRPLFSGKARSSAHVAGDKSLDSLTARGRVVVTDCDFWSVRALDGVVKQTSVARNAVTAGDAAASFQIANRRVHLRRFGINSAALGLQGSGDIGFDGSLNVDVVVAPLGSWRKKIESTGIPIVSQLAGQVVGSIQRLINSATSELLYAFHIGGMTHDPKVTAIPAPILTESAARVFASMLRGIHADKLADTFDAEPDPTTQPATEPGK